MFTRVMSFSTSWRVNWKSGMRTRRSGPARGRSVFRRQHATRISLCGQGSGSRDHRDHASVAGCATSDELAAPGRGNGGEEPCPERPFGQAGAGYDSHARPHQGEPPGGALGSAYWQEEILNLAPAAPPAKTGGGRVGGGGEEDSLALKSFQMAEGVVDQVVGVQDAFVSAENEVGWRD